MIFLNNVIINFFSYIFLGVDVFFFFSSKQNRKVFTNIQIFAFSFILAFKNQLPP